MQFLITVPNRSSKYYEEKDVTDEHKGLYFRQLFALLSSQKQLKNKVYWIKLNTGKIHLYTYIVAIFYTIMIEHGQKKIIH